MRRDDLTAGVRFGSVCSGIEAASVAFVPLGWRAAWFAEIEPFPCAVLAHHYPDVANLGDMTTIARRVVTGEVEAPDVLCGGTPCQAFSVAGLRESLADERGNLALKFVELADAIDFVRANRGEQPAIAFWENVPGVLSTKDNAFGCFLAGLAGEDEPLQPPGEKWANAGVVYGPARAVAWRTLDAQYFGLAQRRRRVFVVASAREGFDPATVLFEWEGLRRDSPPSREAGEAAAGGFGRSVALRGREGGGTAELGDDVQNCLRASTGGGDKPHVLAFGGNNTSGPIDVATARHLIPSTGDISHCLNAGGMGRQDFETETFITHTLRGEGFDASEGGAGRGTPLVPIAFHGSQDPCVSGDVTHPVGRNQGQETCVAFAENSRQEVRLEGGDGSRTGALSTGGGKPGQGVPMVAGSMQVRRLTPRETERLQGFQEIKKICKITVFQHSNSNVCFSDHPSTNVLAELQSHKSPSNASPAEENEFPSNANVAEPNLNAGQASSSAPVLVNAQIDLERQHLQLHSQGKLLLSVSIADASEWCRLPIQAADFVQLSAALLTWLERKAPHGKAESRLSTSGSFPLLIGNLFASQSGQEIEELASDAGKFTSSVKDCMKSITSEAGRNSKSCDSIIQTLLCCVSTAISSFIPEETRAASSYALSVEVSHGYTLIPWRNKPASECPDGPRYKAIGNSWAINCVRWIGRRIDAAIKASHENREAA